MALNVDVEIVFPLTRFGRTRFKARHGNAIVLQGHEQVMHGAWLVGHRDHQAGAIFARNRWRRQGLRQTNDGKPCAVGGFVLNGMCHDVQTKLGGCSLAGQAGPSGVGGGQTRAFGIAGNSTALRMRQVLCEPSLALRQSLGMSQNHFNVFEVVGLAQ